MTMPPDTDDSLLLTGSWSLVKQKEEFGKTEGKCERETEERKIGDIGKRMGKERDW